MVNYLINSTDDITLLTCKECAKSIYAELLVQDCKFMQEHRSIVKELRDCEGIIKITKLVAESDLEDVFFVFEMEDISTLRDRVIVVDSCVEDLVDFEAIPKESPIVMLSYGYEDDFCFCDDCYGDCCDEEIYEEDECLCDECLAVEEILSDDSLDCIESLRAAYRMGRESALAEILEEIELKLF